MAGSSCSARPVATSAPACPAASPTSTTPTARPSAARQPRDGRPRAARRRRRELAARPHRAPPGRDRLGRGPPSARRLDRIAGPVRARSCPATTSGCSRPSASAEADGSDPMEAIMASARRSLTMSLVGDRTDETWVTHDRVPEARTRAAAAARRAGAAEGLARGLRAVPDRAHPHPGQPVHGLRHPVLQQRLPARQPHPRLERPRLPGPLARGHRPAARHQQLPRVHRAAVPGAVRGGLRARHQRRPGHHQAGRGRDHRPGLVRGLGRAACARACAPASGWRSSARARPAWPPPSS